MLPSVLEKKFQIFWGCWGNPSLSPHKISSRNDEVNVVNKSSYSPLEKAILYLQQNRVMKQKWRYFIHPKSCIIFLKDHPWRSYKFLTPEAMHTRQLKVKWKKVSSCAWRIQQVMFLYIQVYISSHNLVQGNFKDPIWCSYMKIRILRLDTTPLPSSISCKHFYH